MHDIRAGSFLGPTYLSFNPLFKGSAVACLATNCQDRRRTSRFNPLFKGSAVAPTNHLVSPRIYEFQSPVQRVCCCMAKALRLGAADALMKFQSPVQRVCCCMITVRVEEVESVDGFQSPVQRVYCCMRSSLSGLWLRSSSRNPLFKGSTTA